MKKLKLKNFIPYDHRYEPDEYVLTRTGSHGITSAWRNFCLGTNNGVILNFESKAIPLKDAIREIQAFAKSHNLKLPKPPKESK